MLRSLFLLPVAVLLPAALGADSVVLKNGDRLTGTLKRLEDRIVTFQSKFIGTVRIKWQDIDVIETDANFSILTTGGRRLDGQLARTRGETTIQRVDSGPLTVPSDLISRAERGDPRRGFRKLARAASGSADVGVSLARGNQNQIQTSTAASAAYSSAQYRLAGRLSSLFARQNGAPSQSRHAFDARLDRFIDSRSFAYALSSLERNERRLLNLRSRAGGGFGMRVMDTQATDLSLLGGLALVHENFRMQENRSTLESFTGVEWATTLFGTVQLRTQLTVHPNVLEFSHVRIEYDGTFRVPITGRFTYSLRLFDRYDSRPAASVKANDYGIVSGVGVSF